MSINLLTLPPEIWQSILQYVFRGNVIKAQLRHRQQQTSSNKSNLPLSGEDIVCSMTTGVVGIILANKQTYQECYHLYFQESQLAINFHSSCIEALEKDKTWSRYYIERLIPKVYLQKTRYVSIDYLMYFDPEPLLKALPALRRLTMPRSFSSLTSRDIRDWKDKVLLQQVRRYFAIDDVFLLAEQSPDLIILGEVWLSD